MHNPASGSVAKFSSWFALEDPPLIIGCVSWIFQLSNPTATSIYSWLSHIFLLFQVILPPKPSHKWQMCPHFPHIFCMFYDRCFLIFLYFPIYDRCFLIFPSFMTDILISSVFSMIFPWPWLDPTRVSGGFPLRAAAMAPLVVPSTSTRCRLWGLNVG